MSSGSTDLNNLEKIEVTTDKLAKAVEMLANNHQVAIKDLSIDNDRKLYKAYLLVKAVVEALVQTDKYQLIPTLVQQQYRPTMIYPGTAGAFLFGCFQGCYGDSHKYCSPLCISNINDTNKPIQCKYQVWVNISRNNDDVDMMTKTDKIMLRWVMMLRQTKRLFMLTIISSIFPKLISKLLKIRASTMLKF